MTELSTLGAVIKTAYEGQPSTNAFTDQEKAKLGETEIYTLPEKEKLGGIQTEATKNATDADLRDRATHTGTQEASTIVDLPDLLDAKVDADPDKGLSETNFTQAEKDKLAELEDAHFKGFHTGLPALQAAHPEPHAGDYAAVDDGVTITWYSWSDANQEWEPRVGESTELLPAQAKTLYESNPDTNAFTDDEKSQLAALEGRFAWRRRGTWDAAENAPQLLNGGGDDGDFYVVTTAGTRSFGSHTYEFELYDWVIYSGGTWSRIAAAYAPRWGSIRNKPPVIAAGATAQAARQAIGAMPDTYKPDWEDVQNKPQAMGGGLPIGTPLNWYSPVLPTGFIWADEYAPGLYPALDAVYPNGMPNFTNRVSRHVGPDTGAVGSTQEDAGQQLTGWIGSIWAGGAPSRGGAFAHQTGFNQARPSLGSDGSYRYNFDSANSPGARTADETRVKAVIHRTIIKAYEA